MRLRYSKGLAQLIFLVTTLLCMASGVKGEVDESVSQHTEDVKGNLISGRDFRVRMKK